MPLLTSVRAAAPAAARHQYYIDDIVAKFTLRHLRVKHVQGKNN